jgi:hypothetical protein
MRSVRDFLSEVFSEWGSAVTGGISAPLFLWALLSSGVPRVVSMALAIACVYVASYRVWARGRKRYEEVSIQLASTKDELNAKADMRGTLWIRRPDLNPYTDQARAGSSLRFVCDCSNHGRKPCQVTRFRVQIDPRPDKGFDGYNNLVLVPPHQVVNTGYGEQFFFETSILVAGIIPADLAESKIHVTLLDALGVEYPNMISKMDAPVSTVVS